jgi:hypothetical protein
MTLHKEWATFIDPRDASTWQIDLTFLSSAWRCIFGSGCKGVHGDSAVGCCSSGVFVKANADDEEGEEDFQLLKKRVKELTDEDWDLRSKYRKNWWKERDKGSGSKHTRLHNGACVFANRGDGPSGTTGCAFHIAALRRGEDPIDWKPWVCGLVPFAIDHDDENQHHTLRAYEHERDWGSGDGEPLDWWCVDAPEAYVGSQPVYRSEASLLRRILGDELYEEVVAYMDARYGQPGPTPINWVGHWGVKPPDGSTSIPLPMAPTAANGRVKP